MILYHGSYLHFEKIDLRKGRKFKDFGQGFYTTKIEKQAVDWAKNMSARFGTNSVFVSIYECNEDLFKNLKYLKFDKATEEWAYFMMNMKSGTALVEALEYKNLNHQISFHTEKGISLLNKVRHYEVK